MRPGTVRRDRWVQHITGHHDTASMRPGMFAGIGRRWGRRALQTWSSWSPGASSATGCGEPLAGRCG